MKYNILNPKLSNKGDNENDSRDYSLTICTFVFNFKTSFSFIQIITGQINTFYAKRIL